MQTITDTSYQGKLKKQIALIPNDYPSVYPMFVEITKIIAFHRECNPTFWIFSC